jgi:hypothetical protein
VRDNGTRCFTFATRDAHMLVPLSVVRERSTGQVLDLLRDQQRLIGETAARMLATPAPAPPAVVKGARTPRRAHTAGVTSRSPKDPRTRER